MALGTKEDGHTLSIILYSQAIIQSKLGVREFASLDNKHLKSIHVSKEELV